MQLGRVLAGDDALAGVEEQNRARANPLGFSLKDAALAPAVASEPSPAGTSVEPIPEERAIELMEEARNALLDQDYPDFEILAVNDASSDETGAVLDEIAASDSRVRVIHFESNQGKAMGLRAGTIAANNEILVCVDGDAMLDRHATRWLVWQMDQNPRVGAVTGNPRVRNSTTLLGKIQAGEFSSIIGLIKRAQRIYRVSHRKALG